MLLSRNVFFLLLLVISTSPFVISKLVWLTQTKAATGKVWFIGNTMELNGAISSHLVILLVVGTDSITFKAPADVPFKLEDPVPVRYERSNPSSARIDMPVRIWGDTFVYCLWPTLVLLVIYLIPPSLDPIIPRRSKILLNRKSIIKIIYPLQ